MNNITISLPSDNSAFLKLQAFIENICDRFNIQNTYFGNILVCLNEALANAIKHGNLNNKLKIVSIKMTHEKNSLNFIITHEGSPHDVDNLINSINPNTTKGLFLIKTLSDFFEFQNEGKSLLLKFNITKNTEGPLNNRKKIFERSSISLKKDEVKIVTSNR